MRLRDIISVAKKKIELTSHEITRALYWKYARIQAHVINNVHLLEFESDFLYVTESGYMSEIEIKVTRSDFRADFKKQRTVYDRVTTLKNTVVKHVILPQGLTGLKQFSFAVPKGLITKDEVPEYAGLCYVIKTPRAGHISLRWIKQPPSLPHPRVISKKEIRHINRSITCRWVDFWLKGKITDSS